MEKLIYMDNAATTSTAPEVVSAMLPFFTEYLALAHSFPFFQNMQAGRYCMAHTCSTGRGKLKGIRNTQAVALRRGRIESN